MEIITKSRDMRIAVVPGPVGMRLSFSGDMHARRIERGIQKAANLTQTPNTLSSKKSIIKENGVSNRIGRELLRKVDNDFTHMYELLQIVKVPMWLIVNKRMARAILTAKNIFFDIVAICLF